MRGGTCHRLSAATAGHDKNEIPTTTMAEEKDGGGGKVVINFNGLIYLGRKGHE